MTSEETYDHTALDHSSRQTSSVYQRFGKRGLDLALGILIVPIIVPVILVLWAIIRFDGGPGFFSQVRIGRGGVPFVCWKLRTMVPNAEEALAALLSSNKDARREWEENQKLNDDPRITKFGHFLRKTSLDELPQLWNVLRGDMSFVGPRPVLPDELLRYGSDARWYVRARPGITGTWQVSGRNDVSYDDRVAMDVGYIGQISLLGDLKILLQTFGEVLRRSGR